MKVNMDALRQTIRTMTTKKGFALFVQPTLNEQKYLGRWQIEQNYSVIHQKVDYANEDHCGVCANGFQIKGSNQEEKDMDEYIKYMM
jgi:hypothetical protein